MEFKKLMQYVEDHKNQHLEKTLAENNAKIAKRVSEKKQGFLVTAASLESTSNNK